MNVEIADPALTDAIWQHVGEGMRKSCEATGNHITAGWLWQECRAGRAFLFVAYEGQSILGAAIVQFEDNGKTLRGLGLCGDGIEDWWQPLHDKVLALMREGGAERFIDTARPGMRKFYEGATVLGVVYEVKI